jgi:general secretion pathway protein N
MMGTVWEGSAALGFSESNGQGGCREPFAQTERFSWSSHCSVSKFACQTQIQFSAIDQPQVIEWSFAKTQILANEIKLPANVLEALGNPWSTLRPRGQLTARWTDIQLIGLGGVGGISPHTKTAQSGLIRIIISNLSSPISPIKPLGSYEISANLDGNGIAWSLSTTNGPLLLKGQGDTKAGLHFEGQAWAAAEAQDSLIGLLVLLGKKEGDIYRLQF